MTWKLTEAEQAALLAAGPAAMADWVQKAMHDELMRLLGGGDDGRLVKIAAAAVLDAATQAQQVQPPAAAEPTPLADWFENATRHELRYLFGPAPAAPPMFTLDLALAQYEPADPRSQILARALANDRTGQ